MKMTLEQYIGNPMAKSALLTASARETMRNEYVNKYNKLMVREHGRLDYQLFKDEKNNRFYAYFKVPSETVEKFYYDVVIEFYTDEDVEVAGQDLFKYNCRFFSNDPSFVYTYAYVFRNNDLFIEGLRSKMSKKAIKTAANEKNPYNQVGYVKTIYFAYLTMVKKSLNRLDFFKSNASRMSMSHLVSMVQDADSKINDREDAGKKQSKENRRRKEVENATKTSNKVQPSQQSLGVKKTNTVKKVNTISKISKTKKK